MIKAESATGHTPGKAATCTEPQTCTEKCGNGFELPKGHHYSEKDSCSYLHRYGLYGIQMRNCDDNYIGDYTDKVRTRLQKVRNCSELYGYGIHNIHL